METCSRKGYWLKFIGLECQGTLDSKSQRARVTTLHHLVYSSSKRNNTWEEDFSEFYFLEGGWKLAPWGMVDVTATTSHKVSESWIVGWEDRAPCLIVSWWKNGVRISGSLEESEVMVVLRQSLEDFRCAANIFESRSGSSQQIRVDIEELLLTRVL